MSLISTIVPVYNVQKVLHYCIDSIINQTFRDFELILVDDGSTDGSDKICDAYAAKDSRIRVIHKSNRGVSTARNLGIDAALGKYICFVDSDDFLEENYLYRLINAKDKYSEFDNIWCCFQTVSDYEKSDAKKSFDCNEAVSFFTVSNFTELHQKWLDASPWNKLYDVKIIRENNIKFPKDLTLGEDLLFNLRYMDCSNQNIVVLNEPLYNYVRNGSESLDNKYYANLFEINKKISETMMYYAQRWNLSSEQQGEIYSFCFFKYEDVLKNTFNKKNSATFRQKIKYNNQILKSEEFTECFNNMSYKVNPIYRIAYKSKNYHFVRFVDKLIEFINKVRK